jgi:hypothetical protein
MRISVFSPSGGLIQPAMRRVATKVIARITCRGSFIKIILLLTPINSPIEQVKLYNCIIFMNY